MGYRKTILANEQIYHIYNRGVARQNIFKEARDYLRLVELLDYYRFKKPPLRFSHFKRLNSVQKKEFWDKFMEKSQPLVEILSFCFMPNHIHLLLKQVKEKGISIFMANTLNSFSRYFNTSHRRVGPLFQANFKAVRIESDEQLVHVNRYIHLNPVTSYLVEFKKLGDYRWSSLPHFLGLCSTGFIASSYILSHFKSGEGYRKFLLDQVDYQRKLQEIKHLIFDK
ncbi:transposase [Candidatus Gottesmanbacteria bacterium]|nr:transposase [Candidatus Gottesmanbacteria bacterium]